MSSEPLSDLEIAFMHELDEQLRVAAEEYVKAEAVRKASPCPATNEASAIAMMNLCFIAADRKRCRDDRVWFRRKVREASAAIDQMGKR